MGNPLNGVRIGDSRKASLVALLVSAGLCSLAWWFVWQGWRIELGQWSKHAAHTLATTRAAFDGRLAIGVVGVFGVVTVLTAAKLFRKREPRLYILPDGIWDPRVAPQMLQWNANQQVASGQVRGRHVIMLQVHPAILATLSLPGDLAENRRLGLKGVPISAEGLAISHWRLKRMIRRYHQAAVGQA